MLSVKMAAQQKFVQTCCLTKALQLAAPHGSLQAQGKHCCDQHLTGKLGGQPPWSGSCC